MCLGGRSCPLVRTMPGPPLSRDVTAEVQSRPWDRRSMWHAWQPAWPVSAGRSGVRCGGMASHGVRPASRSTARGVCAARRRMRDLVAETHVAVTDLIAPLFVREGIDEPQPIVSLPGVVPAHRREPAQGGRRARSTSACGAVILFGVPGHKDAVGSRRLRPRRHRAGRARATCAPRSATTSC